MWVPYCMDVEEAFATEHGVDIAGSDIVVSIKANNYKIALGLPCFEVFFEVLNECSSRVSVVFNETEPSFLLRIN